MTDTSKPIVRLETSSAAKKAQKKAVAEAKEQTIKLAIRLNEGINEALRRQATLIDVSKIVGAGID